MTGARTLGMPGKLVGAWLMAMVLFAYAGSHGAPVEAGDCKRVTVESVTGPSQRVEIEIDGDFGPRTDAAVREFQTSIGLDVANGVVNRATWEKLLAAD